MKPTKGIAILCMTVCALAVTAPAQTWNLSQMLLRTGNQISFNQGANGVWYFLRSSSLAHQPNTYKFLSAYFEPCVSDSSSHFAEGMACWQNPNLERGIFPIPLVGVNFTFSTQFPNGAFGIPPRSVFLHPSTTELVLIGWKSPFKGSVRVAGFFSHLDQSCGNGIIWSVDRGGKTLVSGTIPNGGAPQAFDVPSVSVTIGQVLFFVVDPNGANDFCDASGVDVTITQVM